MFLTIAHYNYAEGRNLLTFTIYMIFLDISYSSNTASNALVIAFFISSASVSPIPSAVLEQTKFLVPAEMNCKVTSVVYPKRTFRRPLSP